MQAGSMLLIQGTEQMMTGCIWACSLHEALPHCSAGDQVLMSLNHKI